MRFNSITITLAATLLMAAFVRAAPVGDALESAGNSFIGDGLTGDNLSDLFGDGLRDALDLSGRVSDVSDLAQNPPIPPKDVGDVIGAQDRKALERRAEPTDASADKQATPVAASTDEDEEEEDEEEEEEEEGSLKRRNENEPDENEADENEPNEDENEPDEKEPNEDENEPDELGDEAPNNH